MKTKVEMMIGVASESLIIEKNKGEVTMVGSGEHTIFVETGVSPCEEMEQVNKYFDDLIEENTSKQKTKVLNLINKKG